MAWNPATVTGTVKDASNNPVTASGYIWFTISQNGNSTSGGFQVARNSASVFAMTNGTIAASSQITANDDISPAGTYYVEEVFSGDGGLIVRRNVTINGPGTSVDIGTLPTPALPSGALPTTGTVTATTGVTTGTQTASRFIGPATGLRSATTDIDVSAATAPSAGQVLTAVNGSQANWQAPSTGAPTTRLINTTAPLTGGGDLSADRTHGISITTTDDGGAVAKQASTPGTQQAGHTNISGSSIVGGDVIPNGNLTGSPASVASKLDLGTRSMSSAPSTAQVLNRVGLKIVGTGRLGADQSNHGYLMSASLTGDTPHSDIFSIEHGHDGTTAGESNGIRVHTTVSGAGSGAGISAVNDGKSDTVYIGARGPASGATGNCAGIGMDINRNTAGTGEQNSAGGQLGITMEDWSQTNGPTLCLVSKQHFATTNVNASFKGDGEQVRVSPLNDVSADTKGAGYGLRLSSANGATTKAALSLGGWLDLPNQPRCLAYNSGNQTISTGSVTTLLFDSELMDVGALHSTSSNTGRITIPTGGDGLWLFFAQVEFQSNGTGQRVLKIQRTRSATTTQRGQNTIQADNAGVTGMQTMAMDAAVAGDYYEAIVYQDSTVSLTANAGVGTTSFGALRLF